MRFEFYFMFLIVISIYGLTCDEVLEQPSTKKLTLTQLQTISHNEIVKCVASLSKYKLTTFEADFIWQSIKIYYRGTQYIPPEILMVLHWVTPVISPEEYLNMTLGDIDVIQNFGLDYKLSEAQLSAIATRIRTDFAGKKPEDYTCYDLIALRNIICAFNKNEIERIHPLAYKDAASMIGTLKCHDDVFTAFAILAIHPDAFGSPKYWDEDIMKTLGKVLRFVRK